MEVLGRKLGILLLSLAGLHFVNLYLFFRLRRRARAHVPPPANVPPDPAAAGWVLPAP